MNQKNSFKATAMQFIRFGLVGVSNTVINYVIYAFMFHMTANYFIANIISWLISVLNAFLWQNIFVFKEDSSKHKRVWWKVLLKTYASYAFTGLILNNVLAWLWVDVIHIAEYLDGIMAFMASYGLNFTKREFSAYLCPILNMVVSVPVNFAMNKFWAYRQKDYDECDTVHKTVNE